MQRATQDNAGESIVVAIVGMGHALGLTVLAEGVETREQAKLLASLGCDQAQGFGISRPTPDLGELFIFCRDFDLNKPEEQVEPVVPSGPADPRPQHVPELDTQERPTS